MASFIFAMVMIFWISTACLSKKRMAVIKEKDGPFGVVLAVTGLLFLISLLFVIIALIVNKNSGSYNSYKLLDAALIFFLIVTGVFALEFIIIFALGPKALK